MDDVACFYSKCASHEREMSLVPICSHIHESTTFAVLSSFLSSFSNLLLTLLPAPALTSHSSPYPNISF